MIINKIPILCKNYFHLENMISTLIILCTNNKWHILDKNYNISGGELVKLDTITFGVQPAYP